MPTASGGAVPLKAVADISFGEGPTRVRRYNQARRLSIVADLNGVEIGTAMKKIKALPALKNLPQGVHQVDVGQAKYMVELMTNFVLAMVTGILMVFAVLVLLFARVFQPITILSSLLLSFGGAVAALLITGNPMSLGAMIGLLMLMGIVAKNAILLVDFAIEEMRAGKDRLTAIVEATHKRARPIVMTTVAMIAGMLPVAVGLGWRHLLPQADGDRGDRRAHHLDRTDAGDRAGAVHGHRRHRAVARAEVRPRAQHAARPRPHAWPTATATDQLITRLNAERGTDTSSRAIGARAR